MDLIAWIVLGLIAGEHFWEYRALARERITQQLGYEPLAVPRPAVEEPMFVSA